MRLSNRHIRRAAGLAAAAVTLAPLAAPAQAATSLPAGGVTARLSGDTSAAFHRQHPDLGLVSIMLKWRQIEPTKGVYSWGKLDESLRDAKARGYRLIIRVMCGADAPAFLGRDGANPVTMMNLIATDGQRRALRVPLPWDADLLVHYKRMITALNAHLQQTGLADQVYFVTSGMPTELGTEMPMGYGRAGQAAANRAVWLRHSPSKGTPAQREAANRKALENAWVTSTREQLQTLTTTNTALALGGLFGDGYAAADRIVRALGTGEGRLVVMTTNLQPKVVGGQLRPWAEWNPGADRAMRTAIAQGVPVGFQTAAERIINTEAKMAYAVRDGMRYGMRFLEVSPTMTKRYAHVLLKHTVSAQKLMKAAI
jgi:hypothetical protein